MVPRFCATCGNPIKPGTRFCPACGWKVSSEEETGPQQASQAPGQGEAPIGQDHAAASNTPPPAMEPPIQTQAQQGMQPPPPATSAAKPPSKKGLLIGIIAGVSVLFIAALSVGGFFILRGLRRHESPASDQRIAEVLRQYEQKLEQEVQALPGEVVDLGIQDTDIIEEADVLPASLDENEDVLTMGNLKASRYAPIPGNRYVFKVTLESEHEGEEFLESYELECLTGKIDKMFFEGELISNMIIYMDGDFSGIYHYIEGADGLLEIYEYKDWQDDPVFVLVDGFYEGMQFDLRPPEFADPDDPILVVTEIGRTVSFAGLQFEDYIIITGRDNWSDSLITTHLAPGYGQIYSKIFHPAYTQTMELIKIEKVGLEEANRKMMMEIQEQG